MVISIEAIRVKIPGSQMVGNQRIEKHKGEKTRKDLVGLATFSFYITRFMPSEGLGRATSN